ncbi:MAG: DUF3800 domain-containing protein [Lachnospiraceae bacterium]|jgi:hypothetical protein|nr:DUF3800 domain-containing protein [Lachnospiraceae bacterium]
MEYNAYIDESGDEGIKRGSDWFILTAIIVKKEADLELSKTFDEIKQNLEMNVKSQLHWNSIKGFPNKKMIIDLLNEQDFHIINILINTQKINSIPSNRVYNYYSGYLFERLIWFLRDSDAININISSRGNLNKKELCSYLQNNNKHKIDFDKIKSIKVYPNAQKKLLQLADVCCSSLGQAIKYNDDRHKYYIKTLSNKLYRKNGNLLSYGLKIVPPNTLPSYLNWLVQL